MLIDERTSHRDGLGNELSTGRRQNRLKEFDVDLKRISRSAMRYIRNCYR